MFPIDPKQRQRIKIKEVIKKHNDDTKRKDKYADFPIIDIHFGGII